MNVSDGRYLTSREGMRLEELGGFETEYGLACTTADPDKAREATSHVAWMAWHETDCEYKETGERRYVDVGHHPEFSTAEDISFSRAAHRVLAGHVAMAGAYTRGTELANERWPRLSIKSTNLFANTSDSLGNSWSSHENLLARRLLTPVEYIDALAVHNLSRIVWSGSGHVLRTDDGSYQFCLSEKAEHIREKVGTGTTRDRPLVNLKDDPLADGRYYRRIHNVSGESVFSSFANALRLASGAIVLRACEIGVSFDDLLPEEPVTSHHLISRDPTLKARVKTSSGRWLTGIELQTEIAERSIAATMSVDYLTDQEVEWGDKWLELCTDLATDPDQCVSRVDWIVKQNLIERELIAKRGSDETDWSVATAKAIDYHRILPVEGMGMRLVRKGFFENSPTPDLLDSGLPLSPTRAKVRGELIGLLNKLKRDEQYVAAHWSEVKLATTPHSVKLPDPYSTDTEKADEYVQSITALATS